MANLSIWGANTPKDITSSYRTLFQQFKFVHEGETIRILNEKLKNEICSKFGLDPSQFEVQAIPHLIEFGTDLPDGGPRPTPDGYVLFKNLKTQEVKVCAYDHKGGKAQSVNSFERHFPALSNITSKSSLKCPLGDQYQGGLVGVDRNKPNTRRQGRVKHRDSGRGRKPNTYQTPNR
jgi:hypothetical protein